MKKVARIVRPSHFALTALACSFAFCGAIFAQAPSASPSHPDGPNVTPTVVNRVGLDAVPANIHFDVVSFKPCPPGKEGTNKVDQPLDGDYLAYHCETVYRLIYFAYNGVVKDYDFVGNDVEWIYADHYEFIAKVAPEDIPAWQKLDLTGRRILIRSVLAATLKLKVSLYNMLQPVYLLTVAKGGAKLKPYKDGDQTKMPDGRTLMGREVGWVGLVAYFQDFTMSQLAQLLGTHLDRNVVDRSGLTAPYTFSIPLAFGATTIPPRTFQRRTISRPKRALQRSVCVWRQANSRWTNSQSTTLSARKPTEGTIPKQGHLRCCSGHLALIRVVDLSDKCSNSQLTITGLSVK